jgi:Uma2 family endonuclease
MELLTIERTERLEDWNLVQIIDGIEFEMPSPKVKHQEIVSELYFLIRQFLSKNSIGRIMQSPLDVIFKDKVDRIQPDLIFVLNQNKHIIKDFIRGIPDLVVEVVSKGSYYVDTKEKKELYQKYGVSEYWIILPEYQSIEIFSFENGKYKTIAQGFDDDIVKSKLLDGFEVKPSQIMQ